MNESAKTHFRRAFDSPYLSSADIVEPIVLTIARVTLEMDRTKKTKDLFNTAWFAEKEIRPGEKLKPMILNATNSKTMKELTGQPFIEDWAGTRVTVYVDHNVKFGKETMEGLRIHKKRPSEPSQETTALVDSLMAACDSGRDAFEAAWKALNKDQRRIASGRMDDFKARCETAADAAKGAVA